jgi:L-rhamnose isomerase
MNRILTGTILTASLALGGQAFADDITAAEPFVSSADRAQVQVQARTVADHWSVAYNPLATFKSERTRAEVRAEYIASRDEVAALTAEDSGSFALSQQSQPTESADSNAAGN